MIPRNLQELQWRMRESQRTDSHTTVPECQGVVLNRDVTIRHNAMGEPQWNHSQDEYNRVDAQRCRNEVKPGGLDYAFGSRSAQHLRSTLNTEHNMMLQVDRNSGCTDDVPSHMNRCNIFSADGVSSRHNTQHRSCSFGATSSQSHLAARFSHVPGNAMLNYTSSPVSLGEGCTQDVSPINYESAGPSDTLTRHITFPTARVSHKDTTSGWQEMCSTQAETVSSTQERICSSTKRRSTTLQSYMKLVGIGTNTKSGRRYLRYSDSRIDQDAGLKSKTWYKCTSTQTRSTQAQSIYCLTSGAFCDSSRVFCKLSTLLKHMDERCDGRSSGAACGSSGARTQQETQRLAESTTSILKLGVEATAHRTMEQDKSAKRMQPTQESRRPVASGMDISTNSLDDMNGVAKYSGEWGTGPAYVQHVMGSPRNVASHRLASYRGSLSHWTAPSDRQRLQNMRTNSTEGRLTQRSQTCYRHGPMGQFPSPFPAQQCSEEADLLDNLSLEELLSRLPPNDVREIFREFSQPDNETHGPGEPRSTQNFDGKELNARRTDGYTANDELISTMKRRHEADITTHEEDRNPQTTPSHPNQQSTVPSEVCQELTKSQSFAAVDDPLHGSRGSSVVKTGSTDVASPSKSEHSARKSLGRIKKRSRSVQTLVSGALVDIAVHFYEAHLGSDTHNRKKQAGETREKKIASRTTGTRLRRGRPRIQTTRDGRKRRTRTSRQRSTMRRPIQSNARQHVIGKLPSVENAKSMGRPCRRATREDGEADPEVSSGKYPKKSHRSETQRDHVRGSTRLQAERQEIQLLRTQVAEFPDAFIGSDLEIRIRGTWMQCTVTAYNAKTKMHTLTFRCAEGKTVSLARYDMRTMK